jgi:BirA family biotin operon repressor/biotin-[acetyl-CoA-carboxylase] ligase
LNDLDDKRLCEALPGWVPEVLFLPETDSTNRRAMAWAMQGAAPGSIVVADFQTAGRGRLGRTWTAPAGSSLLLSIVLRPDTAPERWPLISLAAGVAICECLAGLGLEPGLKWPNDVLLGDHKVAGILSEAAEGAVILGIGLNVGRVDFPREIVSTATSLENFSGRAFNRLDVLSGLTGHLSGLVEAPPDRVPDGYRRWSRTLGRQVRVDLGTGFLEDRAVDIDRFGGLELAGGRVVRAGDVIQVR